MIMIRVRNNGRNRIEIETASPSEAIVHLSRAVLGAIREMGIRGREAGAVHDEVMSDVECDYPHTIRQLGAVNFNVGTYNFTMAPVL